MCQNRVRPILASEIWKRQKSNGGAHRVSEQGEGGKGTGSIYEIDLIGALDEEMRLCYIFYQSCRKRREA